MDSKDSKLSAAEYERWFMLENKSAMESVTAEEKAELARLRTKKEVTLPVA